MITAFNWLNLGKTAITALKNGITGMVETVKSAGSSIRDAVTNGIKELPSKLVAIAKTAISNIKSTFTGGGWRNIGSEIINGIKNGITDAISGLASKAASAAKSALSAAKSALGIKSPSRRFRDEVGKQIPAGAAEGIERNSDLMIDAAKDSADDMISAAQDAVMERQVMTGRNIVSTGAQPQHLTGGAASARGDERILERLERIERAVEAGKNLYLDGKTLVGGTAKRMNTELGKIAIRERGVKA